MFHEIVFTYIFCGTQLLNFVQALYSSNSNAQYLQTAHVYEFRV